MRTLSRRSSFLNDVKVFRKSSNSNRTLPNWWSSIISRMLKFLTKIIIPMQTSIIILTIRTNSNIRHIARSNALKGCWRRSLRSRRRSLWCWMCRMLPTTIAERETTIEKAVMIIIIRRVNAWTNKRACLITKTRWNNERRSSTSSTRNRPSSNWRGSRTIGTPYKASTRLKSENDLSRWLGIIEL